MREFWLFTLVLTGWFLGLFLARGQYPKVTSEVRAEAARRFEAMNRRSDQAWEKARPAIEEEVLS